MSQKITLDIDGKTHQVELTDPAKPLLYVLRDEIGMSNPHFGCGLSQCGACTVEMDGKAIHSCVTEARKAQGHKITTIAGLGTPEHPSPLQQAFIEEQATLCGYCMNGWIMTAAAFLKTNPHPTDEELRKGLSGVKCRCGSQLSIIRAIKRAMTAA